MSGLGELGAPRPTGTTWGQRCARAGNMGHGFWLAWGLYVGSVSVYTGKPGKASRDYEQGGSLEKQNTPDKTRQGGQRRSGGFM